MPYWADNGPYVSHERSHYLSDKRTTSKGPTSDAYKEKVDSKTDGESIIGATVTQTSKKETAP